MRWRLMCLTNIDPNVLHFIQRCKIFSVFSFFLVIVYYAMNLYDPIFFTRIGDSDTKDIDIEILKRRLHDEQIIYHPYRENTLQRETSDFWIPSLWLFPLFICRATYERKIIFTFYRSVGIMFWHSWKVPRVSNFLRIKNVP